MTPFITEREKQALTLLADGLLHKQVAHKMGISGETVKTFLSKARQKLNAKTNIHAIAICLRNGHLQPAPMDAIAAHAAALQEVVTRIGKLQSQWAEIQEP